MLPTAEEKLDPRVVRTRRDLTAALCTLMREKSFSKIRVQDIANEALINRATFYAHFEDKYALLESLVLGAFGQMLDERIAADAGFTLDNIRLLTLTSCEFLLDFTERHSPRHSGEHPPIERILQPYVTAVILSWLKASMAMRPEGSLHTSAECGSPEAMATTVAWSIFGSALQWSREPGDISAETRTTQIMNFLERGISRG